MNTFVHVNNMHVNYIVINIVNINININNIVILFMARIDLYQLRA